MALVFPVKVTVRRLPSTMTQEQFEQVLFRVGASAEARLLYFVPGFVKTRSRVSWARAYLALPSPRAAEEFHALFTAKWAGLEVPHKVVPVVEPSPFQKMPRGQERQDEVSGTLETYEPFLAFRKELEKEKVVMPSADVQMERRQASGSGAKEVIISPLLKDLMEKKLAQLERDKLEMANRVQPKSVAKRGGGRGGRGGGGGGGGAGRGGGGGGGAGGDGTGQPQKKKRGPRRQGRRRGPKKPVE